MDRSHDRSPDQTVLGISMPKALKERIAKAAAEDNRTMANWCQIQLRKIVEAHEEIHAKPAPLTPLPKVERPPTKKKA